MELIYIITYKCNLNCRYCLVKKSEQSMSLKILKRSLKIASNSQIKKIKFFGGEPLLEYARVSNIISKIRAIRPWLPIALTTNGLLLDKEKIDFLKQNKIELVLSLDGNEFTQLKNRQGQNSFQKIISLLKLLPEKTIFNIVIAPNTVNYLAYNFKYLLGLGLRNFNFLPAYYNSWSVKQIKILDQQFVKLLQLIKKENLNKELYLRNINNFSKISFFNQSLVIDWDGQIYMSNAILSEILAPHKKIFLIGNLNNKIADLFKRAKGINQQDINQFVSPQAVDINNQLDKILNNFVYKYKKLT